MSSPVRENRKRKRKRKILGDCYIPNRFSRRLARHLIFFVEHEAGPLITYGACVNTTATSRIIYENDCVDEKELEIRSSNKKAQNFISDILETKDPRLMKSSVLYFPRNGHIQPQSITSCRDYVDIAFVNSGNACEINLFKRGRPMTTYGLITNKNHTLYFHGFVSIRDAFETISKKKGVFNNRNFPALNYFDERLGCKFTFHSSGSVNIQCLFHFNRHEASRVLSTLIAGVMVDPYLNLLCTRACIRMGRLISSYEKADIVRKHYSTLAASEIIEVDKHWRKMKNFVCVRLPRDMAAERFKLYRNKKNVPYDLENFITETIETGKKINVKNLLSNCDAFGIQGAEGVLQRFEPNALFLYE